MRAHRFHYGQPDSGEYILLEQEETIAGIGIPLVRKWYRNKNNRYPGSDTLLKAEPLSSHQI